MVQKFMVGGVEGVREGRQPSLKLHVPYLCLVQELVRRRWVESLDGEPDAQRKLK